MIGNQRIIKAFNYEQMNEERFKEVNFGILEGISTELVRKLNIESPNWLEDLDMDYRPYEGEDIHDVISKHHEALQEIIEDCNEKDTVLIVGTAVRYMDLSNHYYLNNLLNFLIMLQQ